MAPPPLTIPAIYPLKWCCGLSCLASINNKVEGVGPALLKGLVAANVLQTLNFQQQGVDFVTFLQKGPRKNESRIIWEFDF